MACRICTVLPVSQVTFLFQELGSRNTKIHVYYYMSTSEFLILTKFEEYPEGHHFVCVCVF